MAGTPKFVPDCAGLGHLVATTMLVWSAKFRRPGRA
jgi:hypothetical protein